MIKSIFFLSPSFPLERWFRANRAFPCRFFAALYNSSIKWTVSLRSSLRVGEVIKSGSSSIRARVSYVLHVTSIQWKRRVSQAFVDFSSLFNYDRANVSGELIRSSPPLFSTSQNLNFYYTQRAAGLATEILSQYSPSQMIFFVNNIAPPLIEVLGESPSCRKLPHSRLWVGNGEIWHRVYRER